MSGGGKRATKMSKEELEVNEMLRAAEDHLLLGLRVNAHTTSASSSLDPDLARRFEALRSPPPPPKATTMAAVTPLRPPSSKTVGGNGGRGGREADADEESMRVLGDDLAARFAALKGTPGSSTRGLQQSVPISENHEDRRYEDEGDNDTHGEGVSKKEVEKVMQWAMDAARLDPFKSDDEEGGEDDEDPEDLEPQEEEKIIDNKDKGKSKKWFLF